MKINIGSGIAARILPSLLALGLAGFLPPPSAMSVGQLDYIKLDSKEESEEREKPEHKDKLAEKDVEHEWKYAPHFGEKDFIIKGIEPFGPFERMATKDGPWLGVYAEEADEVVSAQLDLQPGVGLVITYVSPNSPAAKAGLKKHDLLAELNGNALVHPAQLRKLIAVRNPGDEISLTFYRGGKKQGCSVELSKADKGVMKDWPRLKQDFQWQFRDFQREFNDMDLGNASKEKMKRLGEAMRELKIDQDKIQKELQRSLKEARESISEALRDHKEARSAASNALKELAKSEVRLSTNATVVVRSSGSTNVRTLVKTDESGTLILMATPKRHLTARDQNGNMLFDGEVETKEQQTKVPEEVWERAKPLFDDLTTDAK